MHYHPPFLTVFRAVEFIVPTAVCVQCAHDLIDKMKRDILGIILGRVNTSTFLFNIYERH